MKKQSPKNKKGSKAATENLPKISQFFKRVEQKTTVNTKEEAPEKNYNSPITNDVVDATASRSQLNVRNVIKSKSLNVDKKRKNSVCNESTSIKSPKKKCISPGPSTSTHRSPLKQLDVLTAKKNNTPRSPRTPEKSVRSKGSSSKTPPPKLFQRTPQKVQDFSVEVLENFVKITPSKCNVILEGRTTPISSGKVQTSLLKYMSPSKSNRSVEAQRINEMTPKKETPSSETSPRTPTSRAKIKLNFGEENLLSSKENKPSTSKENLDEHQVCSENDEISDMLSQNSLDEFCISQFVDFDDDEQIDNLGDENKYTLDLSRSKHCKLVSMEISPSNWKIVVKCTTTEELGKCVLRDFWLNTKLSVGDTIHLMAKKVDSEWLIDNRNGLIVYEPDLLISSTSVVNALFCKRKTVLSEKFHGFEPANEFMIVGTLVHFILQETLKKKLNTIDQIEEVLRTTLTSKSNIRRLYESDQTIDDIQKKMSVYIPRILEFVENYVPDKNNKNNKSKRRNLNNGCWQGTIDNIEDIEENIWCAELGIKGKVDVSVRSDEKIMPLELKTGKPSFSLEHKGQVMLYVMMMNKLGYKVPSGLLLYLRDGIMKEIPTSENEKRDIIILRNELAYYLRRKPKIFPLKKEITPSELPDPINHPSACARCPYNVVCSAFLEYDKNDLSSNKSLNKLKEELLSHLEEQHLSYFIRWSALINLEEVSAKSSSKSVEQIYTVPPVDREAKGKCISHLRISEIHDECTDLIDHTFVKNEDGATFNFFASAIYEGNYCVVSTDGRPAVVSGFVVRLDSRSITVALDRNLEKKFPFDLFHLDTYESSIGRTFNQTSLTLLLENSPRAEELRRTIIDKEAPTFQSKMPKVVASKGIPILRRLNKIQQLAVLKAVSANDFLLIKGMPGTGKTSTIVALIQLLNELGKSVLITSHTHSAVDNVCSRLSKLKVDFLRLGSDAKIKDSLKLHSEHFRTKNCRTPEELSEVYNRANVIATTCMGSGHPILSKRILDVCIVDESTQVLQTTVIKPLYAAKTFVLIGDPEQLPPVVRNSDAIEMGMAESLFDRLQSEESTITLNLNYRMNKKITELANALTYKGDLLVANDTVGSQVLKWTNKESMLEYCENRRWILQFMDTKLENSVKLIDTGPVWNREDHVSWSMKDDEMEDNKKSLCNIYEAAVIVHLVNALLKGGVQPDNIGVIATFTRQVKQLSSLLDQNIDVSTVDQYQGRDKAIIIYSCTKSMNSTETTGKQGGIMEDHRRLNVAITRAKYKLFIVGDMDTVKNHKPFAKLLNCVDKSHIVKLEDGIGDFHWPSVLDNVKQ